jgi:hypothetical protein
VVANLAHSHVRRLLQVAPRRVHDGHVAELGAWGGGVKVKRVMEGGRGDE